MGNVVPNFVAGVEMAKPYGFTDVDEAVKSTSEGLDYLMSQGVTPRLATWCVFANSVLGGQEPPPLDYFIKMSRSWYQLWTKHRLPPCTGYGPIGLGKAVWFMSSHNDWGQI